MYFEDQAGLLLTTIFALHVARSENRSSQQVLGLARLVKHVSGTQLVPWREMERSERWESTSKVVLDY